MWKDLKGKLSKKTNENIRKHKKRGKELWQVLIR